MNSFNFHPRNVVEEFISSMIERINKRQSKA